MDERRWHAFYHPPVLFGLAGKASMECMRNTVTFPNLNN